MASWQSLSRRHFANGTSSGSIGKWIKWWKWDLPVFERIPLMLEFSQVDFNFRWSNVPTKRKNKTAGICFRAFSFCETGQQKTSFQVSLHVSFFGCVSVSWQAGSTFESWWLKASTELVYSALTNTMTVSSLQFWYKMHITFTNSNQVQDHSIQTSKNKRNLSTSDLEGCGG